MSKVKYGRKAQKHFACRKVKRMLTKLLKDFEGVDFYMYPELSGIEERDVSTLKYYITDHYKTLLKRLGEMIKRVDDNEDGYYARPYLERMQLISRIEAISNYSQSDYHNYEQDFKIEYKFKEQKVLSRRYELKQLSERDLKDRFIKSASLVFTGEKKPTSLRFAPDREIEEAEKVEIVYG